MNPLVCKAGRARTTAVLMTFLLSSSKPLDSRSELSLMFWSAVSLPLFMSAHGQFSYRSWKMKMKRIWRMRQRPRKMLKRSRARRTSMRSIPAALGGGLEWRLLIRILVLFSDSPRTPARPRPPLRTDAAYVLVPLRLMTDVRSEVPRFYFVASHSSLVRLELYV